MKNNHLRQLLFLFVANLALNLYVAFIAYRPEHLWPYFFTVLLFMPLILWLDFTKPLVKVAALKRYPTVIKWVNLVAMFCFVLAAIRVRSAEQLLGGLALVPLNLLSVVICLLNPIATPISRKQKQNR